MTAAGTPAAGTPAAGARGALGVRGRLRHLRSGLVASAVVALVGLVAGAVVGGGSAAAGVALGVALVAASFTVSSVIIAWADSVNPSLVLPVGLTTYAVKLTVIGAACLALGRTGWAGLPAFGVGIIVATLGWSAAQAWWTWSAKIPYVDVEMPTGGSRSD